LTDAVASGFVRTAIRSSLDSPLPWRALKRGGAKAPGKEDQMTILVEEDANGDPLSDLMVDVREYLRHRLGQWELVRSHIRKWPNRSRRKGQIRKVP
jgi:hypothetical protein